MVCLDPFLPCNFSERELAVGDPERLFFLNCDPGGDSPISSNGQPRAFPPPKLFWVYAFISFFVFFLLSFLFFLSCLFLFFFSFYLTHVTIILLCVLRLLLLYFFGFVFFFFFFLFFVFLFFCSVHPSSHPSLSRPRLFPDHPFREFFKIPLIGEPSSC